MRQLTICGALTVALTLATAARVALAPSAADGGSTASAAAPAFKFSIHSIDAALKAKMLAGGSWKPRCPVPLSQLRLLKVAYWGFDRRAHMGYLIVNRVWARKLAGVFHTLYDRRFKFRRMRLIDEYGASDARSMAADNTSAFNGRKVPGTDTWSQHAYGRAIDINPLENPAIIDGEVDPPQAAP